MSAPRTARERVREEMTAEILAVAREHVAREGAAALSLRSIARDLEMAPSALYRYFDGRDALLSALILTAYESLADEAERAADDAARRGGGGDAERWLAVPRSLRAWALAHPHEWGLIFGTPVPGYEAPEDTVEPYVRVAAAMVRPLVAAAAAARLRPGAAAAGARRAGRRGGAGRRGAPPRPAAGNGRAGHRGLDHDRRRHQPRGLRALAQHHLGSRPVLRGHRCATWRVRSASLNSGS